MTRWKILCVHGDMVCYPTATVKLQLGRWSRVARVVVAPGILVPVLLGTDIYDLIANKPLLVITRAQLRGTLTAAPRIQKVTLTLWRMLQSWQKKALIRVNDFVCSV